MVLWGDAITRQFQWESNRAAVGGHSIIRLAGLGHFSPLLKHGNTLRDPLAPRWSRTATTMDDWRGPFLVLHHEPITHKVSSLGWVCSQFAPKQKGNSVKYKTAQRFNNHEWNPSLICPQGMSLILLILWGSHPCFLMCVVCRSEHPECLGGGQQGSAKQLWP